MKKNTIIGIGLLIAGITSIGLSIICDKSSKKKTLIIDEKDDTYNEIMQRSDKEKHIWNMFTKVSSAVKRNDTATATALLNTIEVINNGESEVINENIQTYRIMLDDNTTT